MNDYIENIKIAFSAIRMNALRTILTIFIIAFGIMALISMLTAVDGIKRALYSSFASVGSNTFTIQEAEGKTKFRRRGRKVSYEKPILYKEAKSFSNRFNFQANVSISYEATESATVKHKSTKTPPKIKVIGSDESYLSTSGFTLEEGRNFTNTEVRRGVPSAIIGYKLKDDIFGEQEAIGESLIIGSNRFTIIGYLREKGSSFGGSQDNIIIVPVTAAQNTFPNKNDNYLISVQVNDITMLENAINEATGLFRIIRKLKLGDENDFTITRSDSLADILKKNIVVITAIAFVIGIITLIGAAVGLTNIMLVSVTERTREIGVRKALGATTKNIRNQFLWEALVICQLGGLLGIVAGIFLGNIVSSYFEGEFIIPWLWIIVGVIISMAVGVIAGMYPALKAAKLDPVESLRYE